MSSILSVCFSAHSSICLSVLIPFDSGIKVHFKEINALNIFFLKFQTEHGQTAGFQSGKNSPGIETQTWLPLLKIAQMYQKQLLNFYFNITWYILLKFCMKH